MALKDEVRVDESSAKRSQITGHLLIVVPKMNAENCVTLKKAAEVPTTKSSGLKQAVNIRNIVVDELEVPPLIWGSQ